MSVSASFAEDELQKVWTLSEPQQRRLLRPALAKLYEGDVSEAYLTEWMSTLHESAQITTEGDVSHGARRHTPFGGHTRFFQLCLETGLTDVMLKVADLRIPGAKRARINALSILCMIFRHAMSNPPTAALLEKRQTDLKIVVLRSLQSDLFMERAHAIRCIQVFASFPSGTLWSNRDISDLAFGCLSYAQTGHQIVLDELRNKKLSWQRELLVPGPSTLSEDEALTFAPQFWSIKRDEALDAVSKLLSTRSGHTVRRDCLEIITSEPRILGLLLTVIDSFERSPWHPEGGADAAAAQILVQLLMPPHLWISELSETTFSSTWNRFPPGQIDNSDIRSEWQSAVSSWKIFVERCNWQHILLKRWKKLQTETREDVLKIFQQRPKNIGSSNDFSDRINKVFNNRGACRSCILRIFINLTYGGTETGPVTSTNILLSLLPTAYEASQKVPSEARVIRSRRHADGAVGQRDALTRQERLASSYQAFAGTPFGQKYLVCVFIHPEYILGPVLLFRILRRVYETFGSGVTNWVSLPDNSLPKDHLGQVQQIASIEVLGIVIRNVVLKRIPNQKAEGSKHFQDKITLEGGYFEDIARFRYLAAAELALAAERFCCSAGPGNVEWEGLMPLVKKELVACLGNASYMSSRLGEWHEAWWYAAHALDSLDGVDQAAAKRNGWEPASMRSKNEMRLAEAEAKIIAHR